LIDHKLEDGNTGIFKTGSTAAAFIREQWPDCPIVCITGVDMHEVDSQQRSLYEELYPYNRISRHYETILSIAKAFKKIKTNRPSSLDEVLSLMKALGMSMIKLSL
jgi:hypothetical protein